MILAMTQANSTEVSASGAKSIVLSPNNKLKRMGSKTNKSILDFELKEKTSTKIQADKTKVT